MRLAQSVRAVVRKTSLHVCTRVRSPQCTTSLLFIYLHCLSQSHTITFNNVLCWSKIRIVLLQFTEMTPGNFYWPISRGWRQESKENTDAWCQPVSYDIQRWFARKSRFQKTVFYVLIDNSIAGLTGRFKSVKRSAYNYTPNARNATFTISTKETFGKTRTETFRIAKFIHRLKYWAIFPNVWVILRIFLTISSTVASAGRSFSRPKFIKRSLMSQHRLVDLARLSIETRIPFVLILLFEIS